MRVIYADLIFLVNALVNYIMLIVTSKITGQTANRLRVAGSACLGGFYAVLCALPPLEFLSNPAVKAASGVLLVFIASGPSRCFLRFTLVFFAVSAAFAGLLLAVTLIGGEGVIGGVLSPGGTRMLVLTFIVSYILISAVFGRTLQDKGKVHTVTVRNGARRVNLTAIVDTGNSLCDPMTGRAVIVTSVESVRSLFEPEIWRRLADLKSQDAARVLEGLSGKYKFRLVPYSAVGVTHGMMLAFIPDEIIIDGKKTEKLIIALSPASVSDSGTYTALLGVSCDWR